MVVPFLGSDFELSELRARLLDLRLDPADELIVADNRRDPVRTPASARNRGARQAGGEWLLFVDADTRPEPGLIEAYFQPAPGERTGVLAGAARDEAAGTGLVARHAVARAQISQHHTLSRSGLAYAQTVNCAVLRSAFEQVGGFAEDARAGEDADLCFRLQQAGWQLEGRPAALVWHRTRDTLPAWLGQLARHGSGAAWVNRRWPGQFPPPPPLGFVRRLAGYALSAIAAAARGDREGVAFALLDGLGAWAFELGRLLSNSPRKAHLRGFRR